VYTKPLLGEENALEVPSTSPGIVLDGFDWSEFYNGIEALAQTGPTYLQVKLYSNKVAGFETGAAKAELERESILPRDTYSELAQGGRV
jgi:hypothetical protein